MHRTSPKPAKPLPAANPQADVETAPLPQQKPGLADRSQHLWLVILWSAREPHRVGERAPCDEGQKLVLGRAPQIGAGEQALSFSAMRPREAGGVVARGHEVLGEALSRRQLEIRAEGNQLTVRNVGRCPMWVNGALAARAQVCPGDTIHLQQQVLLLCVAEQREFPSLAGYPLQRLGSFGTADQDGIVGESPAIWDLRRMLALYGRSDGHILIVGKSGSGKDLVARALYNLSMQKNRAFVAENIATIPPNLGTALIFGNRRNFPNPGMEERPGLIGMAEGGTLFLDEIGDMNADAQPLLLRVMERGGEYVRLGDEAEPRRANVRFIGATNHPERLRPELRRRFLHEIQVPELNQRREDIPLLIRHTLELQAERNQRLGRYLHEGWPNIDPLLVDQLVRHTYSTEVSELSFLLGQAAVAHEEPILLPLAPEVLQKRTYHPIATEPAGNAPLTRSASAALPTVEQAQRALDLEAGSVRLAAVRLGISRYQLYRLVQQHGLVAKRGADAADE